MCIIEIYNERYNRDIIDKMSLVAQFHVIVVWFKHIWFISFHIKRDILHGPYLVRAGVASSCKAVKTIEETFMKHDKSHGGTREGGTRLMGILTNFNAYQRWVKTAHETAQYVDVTYSKADM